MNYRYLASKFNKFEKPKRLGLLRHRADTLVEGRNVDRMITRDFHPRKVTIDVGYSNKLNTESSVQAISEIDEQSEVVHAPDHDKVENEEQPKSNESDHINMGMLFSKINLNLI